MYNSEKKIAYSEFNYNICGLRGELYACYALAFLFVSGMQNLGKGATEEVNDEKNRASSVTTCSLAIIYHHVTFKLQVASMACFAISRVNQ